MRRELPSADLVALQEIERTAAMIKHFFWRDISVKSLAHDLQVDAAERLRAAASPA